MNILLVTHIFRNVLPEIGLRRLQYFTTTPELLGKDQYYLGASTYHTYQKDWIEAQRIIVTLVEPVEITTATDLFVSSTGQLIRGGLVKAENPEIILENLFG
jgi:hypothetical protein